MFKYSDSNKRYYTLDYFYKHKFNSKVFKVSLDGGFTCPNKDGTKGIGGCIYCSKSGSGEYAGDKRDDIVTQFEKIKSMMLKKWNNAKYIGYFQANSNTYAEVDKLKNLYEPILKQEGVVGLSVATRCDAISEECLDYLSDLNSRTYLTVELGLQTIHEDTSKLINRCHTLDEFTNMVNKLRQRNINVVVHIINGLPYETHDMMIDTVKFLSDLDIQGIKIHALSILKDTELEKMYNETHFKVMSREDYIQTVCDQLEYLREDIVIHRFSGDPPKELLVAPDWMNHKKWIMNGLNNRMKQEDLRQGMFKNC